MLATMSITNLPRYACGLRRGCQYVSPYRAGFEDYRYLRVYNNPFRTDTTEFMQYDNGHEDARKSEGKQ